MHVLLTDVLTCPRCGPEFGLILLADRTEDRRVYEGRLGCANCREQYQIRGGMADLRYGPDTVSADQGAEDMDPLKLAALLGVTEGPALILVTGPGAAAAGAIADLIPGLEVIAVSGSPAEQQERSGISRIAASGSLPFRSASMRGVAVTGAVSDAMIAEAARVVAPRSRVVVTSGATHLAERLEQHGLRMLARDASAAVAERPRF